MGTNKSAHPRPGRKPIRIEEHFIMRYALRHTAKGALRPVHTECA